MSLGFAVVLACALAFGLKVAGFSVPAHRVEGPTTSRALVLLPIALLSGLVAVQTFDDGGHLALDARLAGLSAAVVALLLRAPFLVVIGAAALAAAGLRWLGWAA
jgi:hypothetical protein